MESLPEFPHHLFSYLNSLFDCPMSELSLLLSVSMIRIDIWTINSKI